ncbi:MAG: CGNR zinc finger domain-containing protein [Bryobacteraceae bacterium]|jgi:predicted RNA-binding Zn ribbon-like protein
MPHGNLSKIAERLHVKFVGGRLCLDFVNTVGGRAPTGAPLREKISCFEDWLDWSLLAGSLTASSARALARLAAAHPAEAADTMNRAMRLRESLYGIFKCTQHRRRPAESDADILRAELAIARSNQRLTAYRGRFAFAFPPSPESLDRVLWPVALSAAELLTSDDLAAIRECPGPDCGWLFLDTSRNRRRRWCDMQDCGNRAKVRRFRTKATPVPEMS